MSGLKSALMRRRHERSSVLPGLYTKDDALMRPVRLSRSIFKETPPFLQKGEPGEFRKKLISALQ